MNHYIVPLIYNVIHQSYFNKNKFKEEEYILLKLRHQGEIDSRLLGRL